MPTSATPAFRMAQNLRIVGVEPDSKRSFRAAFRSQTPARPVLTDAESRAFQRSRANILGPGSYEPTPFSTRSEWVKNEEQLSCFFQSAQPIRPTTTSLVDLHGRVLQENSKDATEPEDAQSVLSFRSVFGMAPGAPGKSFSRSLREIDRPQKARDPGHEKFYDCGSVRGSGTVTRSLQQTSRLYASPFSKGLPARPPVRASGSTPALLGPGAYYVPEDAQCGGIIRMRENFRPSSNMHPKVGGKFAHLGLDWM